MSTTNTRTNVLVSRVDDGSVVRKVYGLHGPNGQVRYVGITTQPGDARLHAHRRGALADVVVPVYDWMRSEGPENVSMRTLFVAETDDDLRRMEQWFIKELKAAGVPLTNATPGGDGSWSVSDETRSKISQGVLRGRKSWVQTDEHRAKVTESNRRMFLGTHQSEEMRARKSATERGMKETDAYLIVLSEWDRCPGCGVRFGRKQMSSHQMHGTHGPCVATL